MPLPMTGNPPVWHAHPLPSHYSSWCPCPSSPPCSTAATSQAVLAHSFNMLVSHLARRKIANRMGREREGGETERKLRAKWFSYFGISASYAYTSSTCTSWYFHLFISQINEASSAHFHATFHIVIYYYCPPPSAYPPLPVFRPFSPMWPNKLLK